VTACPTDQLFGHLEQGAALIPGAVRKVSPERTAEDDLAAAAAMMLDFLDGK
jgi:hypothetical protein